MNDKITDMSGKVERYEKRIKGQIDELSRHVEEINFKQVNHIKQLADFDEQIRRNQE